MSCTLFSRRLVAVAAVGVCAVAGAALVADVGRAEQSGRTYTITTLKTRGSVCMARREGDGVGRLNPGNRLLETNDVRRDDGVRGVFVGTVMVASPRTVAATRAVGMMRAVYRFGDGDIYVDGFVTFARPSGTGVIVGGTGAYRGARGTVTSTGQGRLEPAALIGPDWRARPRMGMIGNMAIAVEPAPAGGELTAVRRSGGCAARRRAPSTPRWRRSRWSAPGSP